MKPGTLFMPSPGLSGDRLPDLHIDGGLFFAAIFIFCPRRS